MREEVFYALAGAKCPIYQMSADDMSLEDIFLEMTKDEGKSLNPEERLENSDTDAEEDCPSDTDTEISVEDIHSEEKERED